MYSEIAVLMFSNKVINENLNLRKNSKPIKRSIEDGRLYRNFNQI